MPKAPTKKKKPAAKAAVRPAPKPAPEPEPAPEAEPAVSPDLQAVFAKIASAERKARSAATARDAIEELKAAASQLDDETLSRLLAEEGVDRLLEGAVRKVSGLQPGDPVLDANGRELMRAPYTKEWVEANSPLVEWVVPMPHFGRRVWEGVSWNGVMLSDIHPDVVLRGNETVVTRAIFRDLVLDSWRETARTLNSQRNILENVGARAADGVTFEGAGGFVKKTVAELLASGEWVEK
jgi:hypothetical protein